MDHSFPGYLLDVAKTEWIGIFSDVRLTQCSPRESYSSNWSQNFLCSSLKSLEILAAQRPVIHNSTQLSHTLHNNCCTIVITLFRLFVCSSTFQCGNKHSAPNLQPDSHIQTWHSGGCQNSQGDSVRVPFKMYLHGCRMNFPDWLLPLTFLFLDALLPRVFGVGGSEGGAVFGVGFARSFLSCRKLHWSPFEHWAFFSPQVAFSLSSFNTT